MSLRTKAPRNRWSTRRFPIGPTPTARQLNVADRRWCAWTSGCFGVPTDQFAFSERTGPLLTVVVSAEKSPLPRTTLRSTDHLDRQAQFGGASRADDVTDPDLRWVDLERVAPVVYRHVTHPRSCHQPTRYPALPGRMANIAFSSLAPQGIPAGGNDKVRLPGEFPRVGRPSRVVLARCRRSPDLLGGPMVA